MKRPRKVENWPAKKRRKGVSCRMVQSTESFAVRRSCSGSRNVMYAGSRVRKLMRAMALEVMVSTTW